MSIFQINESNLAEQLVPPMLRQPNELAWFTSLTQPLQYNNDLFVEYLTGSTYPVFTSGSTYSTNDRVIYTNRGVYESISGSTGSTPTDTNYWNQINLNYIGAQERSKYNARKLDYEFALNRWFETSGFTPTVMFTVTPALFTASAQTIYIETKVVTPPGFMMGNTGQYSSMMSNNSQFATTYMGNSGVGAGQFDYVIWVPMYIYSGITESIVRNFADTINIAGMQYSVSGY